MLCVEPVEPILYIYIYKILVPFLRKTLTITPTLTYSPPIISKFPLKTLFIKELSLNTLS